MGKPGTPTPREVYLQNLLAMAATLLFRATTELRSGSLVSQKLLVIECEAWFSETRNSLTAALSAEVYEVSPTSAEPAETSGDEFSSPVKDVGWSRPPLANPTEIGESEGVSSSPSSTGTTPPEAPKKNALQAFLDL